MGLLRGESSPKPGLTTSTAGTYNFRLTVSDGRTTSTVDTVSITVLAGTPPNQTLTSVSAAADSGFVNNSQPTTRFFSNTLRTGKSSTTNEYRGAAQFVLPATPAGMTLSGASLQLMGHANSSNTAGDSWTVDLLPTSADANWTSTSWNAIGTVTPDATLSPSLDGLNQVVANSADTWTFGIGDLAILASRIAGSSKLSIRTKGNGSSSSSQVYWRGGSATTATDRPTLTLTYSPNAEYDRAPIARAGLDQTGSINVQVTLNGAGGYDYEDASVSHAWTQLGGPTITLSSASAANPTFTPTVPGVYRLRDTVTDSASQTSADEVIVTVLPHATPALTSHAYNGDGDRVSQTVDGVTTNYVVNSTPKLSQVLMETTGANTTYLVYGHDLLYSVKADGPHYHHTDSLGSTIAITDSTGAVEQTMDYDVFGRMRSMTGTNGTTYTFTGEENDALGLVFLRARYYDPAAGRFLSRDPHPGDIADTQTVNRYAYVKNNPTNYVDPSGEFGKAATRLTLWTIGKLPPTIQLRILYGAAGVKYGAQALNAPKEDFKQLSKRPLSPQVAGGGDESWANVVVKDKVFGKARHAWSLRGGATPANMEMVQRLAVREAAGAPLRSFDGRYIQLDDGLFYLGWSKGSNGVITVNTAYYVVANPAKVIP
jgi:RHS repeat-associated protein